MKIKFVVSPYRNDKHKKNSKPIKRSKYFKYLWECSTFKE